MLGAIVARAEAQVVRLGLIYALLDGATAIGLPHLEAALEVWRYADDSAAYVFGRALGDPVADTILTALRGKGTLGLTRSEIAGLFSRHHSSARLDRALTMLARGGLAAQGTRETA